MNLSVQSWKKGSFSQRVSISLLPAASRHPGHQPSFVRRQALLLHRGSFFARRAVCCALPAAFCLLRLAATPDLMAHITSGPPSILRLSDAISATSGANAEARMVAAVSAARLAIRAQLRAPPTQ